MSGINRLLLDTNAILDLLKGNDALVQIANGSTLYISFINELEVLSYPLLTKQDEKLVQRFFSQCIVVDISLNIKALAISIRRSKKVKLPDAIVAATAMALNVPIVTADTGFWNIKGLSVIKFDPI